MRTLLLDRTTWDLCRTTAGNIAVADNPYALAQDAASAIRLFLGELYYKTEKGVPYWELILGKSPPPSLMKAKFIAAAMTVPGVKSSRCFIASIEERHVRGQVQVTDKDGRLSVAGF